MVKLLAKTVALFTLVIFAVSTAYAASLSLTKIGSMDLGGKTYTEWWYTGTNPLLSGTGDTGSQVAVKIDTNSANVSVDSSGNWTYQTSLAKGDYKVEISQGSGKYAFTLHLGQDFPGAASGTTGQSTSSVPSTGFDQIAGISMGIGVVLLSTYLYVWGDTNKKIKYRKNIIED